MTSQYCSNPPSLYWLAAMAIDSRLDLNFLKEGLPNVIKDVDAVKCSCFNINTTSSIRFLKEEDFELSDEEIKTSIIYINTIDKNHLDCFKTAFNIGILLTEKICDLVVIAGELPFLEFIHKNGCALTEMMCFLAAYYGNFPCYEYIVRNGVRPRSLTLQIYEDSFNTN